jgi:hypothetical protein
VYSRVYQSNVYKKRYKRVRNRNRPKEERSETQKKKIDVCKKENGVEC